MRQKLIFGYIGLLLIVSGCSLDQQGVSRQEKSVSPSISSNSVPESEIPNENLLSEHLKITKINDNVTQVLLPYSDYSRPDIRNNKLYVPVNQKSETVNTILQIDLASSEEKQIYHSRYKINSAINNLMVNSNHMTWEDSTVDGLNSVIIEMDNSLKQQQIGQAPTDILKINAPYLYKDYVAWIDLIDRKSIVKLYDLKAGKTINLSEVSTPSLYNNFVHMDNDQLVWSDSKDGVGQYHVYDLRQKKTINYKASKAFPGYARISGEKIFANEFDDDKNWNSKQFGYYDLQTKTFKPFESNQVNTFITANSYLALLDEKQNLQLYRIIDTKIEKISIENAPISADNICFASTGDLIAGRILKGHILLDIVHLPKIQ